MPRFVLVRAEPQKSVCLGALVRVDEMIPRLH
jgi:hypothetical protein